jgi:hypothetical protein
MIFDVKANDLSRGASAAAVRSSWHDEFGAAALDAPKTEIYSTKA